VECDQQDREALSPIVRQLASLMLSWCVCQHAARCLLYSGHTAHARCSRCSHQRQSPRASLQAALDAVQPADLQRVAAQYLKPEDTNIGIYADSSLEGELAFLGRVQVYRAELK
jgi:hypothetical protein